MSLAVQITALATRIASEFKARGKPLAVTLTVVSVALGYAEVVLAAPGVTASTKVTAALASTLDEENDIEELADSAMSVVGVAEADQIRFVLTSANASNFVGAFKVNYQVAA